MPIDNWAILEGALLPALIAVIIRRGAHWSDDVKSMLAFGVCLLAGAITCWLNGQLDFSGPIDTNRVAADMLLVASVAYATYQKFWKPTQIAPTIERITG